MIPSEIEKRLRGAALGVLLVGALVANAPVAVQAATVPGSSDPAPAQAQTQAPPRFGTGAALVRLDVVVRDKRGHVVRDLRASDFEVLEDGATQTLETFRVFSRDEAALPASARAAGEASPAPAIEPDALPPSVVAFVFDRLSPEARGFARKAALAHLDAGRTRGWLAGVFSVDLALHLVEPFTTDPERVRVGIEKASGAASVAFSEDPEEARRRLDDMMKAADALSGPAGGGQQNLGMAATAGALAIRQRMDIMEAQVRRATEALERDQQGHATMNGLLGVISVLEPIPGRKAIVLLSEGLKVPASVEARFRSVIAAANRAEVSVYALDAGGLRVKSPLDEAARELAQAAQLRSMDATGDISVPRGPMTRQIERSEDLLRLDPRTGLGQLADETGGFLVHDGNDAARGLERVGEDLRFHYVLAYAPTNDARDGAFRRVAVHVRRPGLQVQTRKGYVALATGVAGPARGQEARALAELDRVPRPTALALRVIALSFPEPRRPGLVPVLVEVPREGLRYAPGTDGDAKADLTVAVRITNEHAQEVARLGDRYLLPPAEAIRGPLQFYREVDLPPGRYTVESVAYDATSRAAGVRTCALLVPVVSDHDLRLSSLVLARGAAQAASVAAESGPLEFGGVSLYPNLGEPLHKHASPVVGFFFSVYGDPDADAHREATIEVRRGDETLGRSRTELPSLDARGRVQHAGTLSLEALAPGPYTLAVTVTDGRRSDTRQAEFLLED